jgi:D-alanyl-lipoteichoic acid acyltransferase DltB (MBOAT superfamily)
VSFVSVAFLIFYILALALRATLGRGETRGAYLSGLLVLSLVFYSWHVPSYVLLIFVSTLTDYAAARALEASSPAETRRRSIILAASIAVNLGLLGTFKYAGFFLELANDLAALFGADRAPHSLQILLPIGISFYTFQSMSYTIDVYRGHLAAERSFVRFALYVAFFPQLVAGPIVRAGAFLYQIQRRRKLRARVFLEGGYLIVRGLFLKMVVADNLGQIVDAHWPKATADGASPLLAPSLAVFFSCQLFCDFAGYSDIARGLAYQLGFRLPVNFRAPFLATTFQDFWRRWHITLSQWMRDYVYVPLGGNRGGHARALANLGIVMLVSGLWHGAHMNFVAWGAMHGAAAVGERVLGVSRWVSSGSRGRRPGAARAAATLVWFLVVQIVWIVSMAVFRSTTGEEAGRMLFAVAEGVASLPLLLASGETPDDWVRLGWWFTLPVWMLHARAFARERSSPRLARRVEPYERALYAGIMVYAILTLYATSPGFIYFQF